MSAYLNFQSFQSLVDRLTDVQKTALRDTLNITTKIAEENAEAYDDLYLMKKALSGDMVLVCTPDELDTELSNLKARQVIVTVETEEGEIHTWLNAVFEDAAAIEETTAGDGVALLDEVDAVTADVEFVNGVCALTIYQEDTWAADDTNTLTVGADSSITILGKALTEATSEETVVADPEE